MGRKTIEALPRNKELKLRITSADYAVLERSATQEDKTVTEVHRDIVDRAVRTIEANERAESEATRELDALGSNMGHDPQSDAPSV